MEQIVDKILARQGNRKKEGGTALKAVRVAKDW